jgi:exopolyphosphatase/guanosine-5'-triphosphate,3'-diphosphate pyrophosphatase
MSEAQVAPPGPAVGRNRASQEVQTYAALDLGTNNCRLLIATPSSGGFRVVESYSRIVRLGEGMSHSGLLSEDAMKRTLDALQICADKIARRRCSNLRAVATQACRLARNGPEFVQQVESQTGIKLDVIRPKEEARLSVAGCVALLDKSMDAALVIDVGGGSTELSWVDLKAPGLESRPRQFAPWRLPIRSWLSAPVGVVTLAERFPETSGGDIWFRSMVDAVKSAMTADERAEAMRPIFEAGRAHMVGTSGAITSLAGLHLGLAKYDRRIVDGAWMTLSDCQNTTARLMSLSPSERAAEPCIGADRADLVLAGAAILTAIQELWPCEKIRVADRGLREGLLLSLMSDAKPPSRNRRRRSRRSGSADRSALHG